MRADRSQDLVDDAIDAAARSMTDGAPHISLRVRVRQRIARSVADDAHRAVDGRFEWAVGRPFTSRVAWGAIVVVIVAVAVLMRDAPLSPNRVDVPAVAVVRPQVQAQTTQRVEQSYTREIEAPVRAPVVTVLPENIVVPEDAVALEPVEIEPLSPTLLEMELIEAPMPLRAEWVEIEPIVIE